MRTNIILLVFSLIFVRAEAQWTQLKGPQTGVFQSIFQSGNTLFLGSIGSGVYRSDDQGLNWVQSNSGIDAGDYEITCFYEQGSEIYIGTNNGRIYHSNDHGLNWVDDQITLIQIMEIGSDANYLIAFDLNAIKRRPLGTGQNWETVAESNDFQNFMGAEHFARVGTDLFIADYGGVLLKSSDSGANWSVMSKTGLPQTGVMEMVSDGVNLYVGTGQGVYISRDQGTSWELAAGLPATEIDHMYQQGSEVYISSSTGYFRTSDGGVTWTFFRDPAADGVFSVSGTQLFLATTIGFYESSDYGQPFKLSENGINGAFITGIGLSGNNILVTTGGVNLWYSSDSGQSWIKSLSAFGCPSIECIEVNEEQVLVGSLGLYVSTDHGLTFSNLHNGIPSNLPVSSIEANGNDIYINSVWDIYASHDRGASWTKCNTGKNPNSAFYAIGSIGNRIFIGGNESFYSDDLGNSWNKINFPFTAPVTSIENLGNSLFVSVSSKGIYRSDDLGVTWTLTNTWLPDHYAVNVMHSDGIAMYAGSGFSGIFQTENLGTAWSNWNDNLAGYSIGAIQTNSTHVFAGTRGNGIWIRPKNEVVSGLKETAMEYQPNIYPNPAHDVVHLVFAEHVGQGTVKLLDATGKIVLENTIHSQDEITLDASQLPEGMYVLQTQTAQKVSTQKLVIQH